MKKILLVLCCAFIYTINYAQLNETFDNSIGFAVSEPFFSDATVSTGFDFFGISDGAGGGDFGAANPANTNVKSYTGFTGNFLTGMDLDGEGATLPITITWSAIDISSLASLSFSGDFAEFVDGSGNIDADDFIRIEVQIDGGGFTNILEFRGNNDGSNEKFAVDTNNDGFGDGLELSAAAQNFVVNIAGTGNSLDLKISVSVNSGNEDFGMDNIKIDVGAAIPPNVTFDNALGTETETNATFNATIPVTLTNHGGTQVDINIAVTGGTAEAGDYTLNTTSLSFTADGTQNVSIDINPDADGDDETIILTLSETSATGATSLPNITHTLTISDDEIPSIVITEIMYNTPGVDDEWIEIYNNEGADVDISGYTIEVGGSTEFTFPASTTILDGAFLTIALGSNGDGTYNNDNPFTPDFNSLGVANAAVATTNSTNTLSNSTQTIALKTAGGSNADIVTYDDGDVSGTDGQGASMEIIAWQLDNSTTAINWQASAAAGGSPGSAGQSLAIPIELSTFTATTIGEAINVFWRTETEENNAYMVLERSADAKNFYEIAVIEGNGTTYEPIEYTYLDESPLKGINFYRIRQVDFDGTINYHGIVSATIETIGSHDVRILPNIVSSQFDILFSSNITGEVQLSIYNMNGQVLRSEVLNTLNGRKTINISDYQAGVYVVVFSTENQTITKRIVKQ